MQFEGRQINIPIKGIERAGTDNLCADGAMNEVIGLEFKDGSWLPYQATEGAVKFLTTADVVNAWVHKTNNGGSHYIALANDNGTMTLMYETARTTGTTQYVTLSSLTTDVKDVAFVGNILNVATDRGIEYYRWKDDDYERIVTEPTTKIHLRVTEGCASELRDDILGFEYVNKVGPLVGDITSESTRINEETHKNMVLATMIAARGHARDNGGLTGYFLACVAYRLKNGELVAASAPMLMHRPWQAFGSTAHEQALSMEQNRGYDTDFLYSHSDDTYVWKNLAAGDETKAVGGETPTKKFSIFTEPKNRDYNDPASVSDPDLLTKIGPKEIRYVEHEQPIAGGGTAKVYIVEDSDQQALCTVLDDQKTGWSNYRGMNMPCVPQLACTRLRGYHGATGGGISSIMNGQNIYWYYGYAATNKLQYKVADLGNIKDSEIQSVCIFMSQEIDAHDLSQTWEYFDRMVYDPGYTKDDATTVSFANYAKDFGETPIYDINDGLTGKSALAGTYYAKQLPATGETATGVPNLIDRIKELKGLYLVKEIYTEELEAGDWVDVQLKGLLGDTLLTREQLPMTAFTRDTYVPEHLDTYNYRLHQFDYKTSLFKGYTLPEYAYYGGDGQYPQTVFDGTNPLQPLLSSKFKWEAKVEISDTDGTSTVVTYDNTQLDSLIKSLSPIITYPNKDAKSITINVYEYQGYLRYCYSKTMTLSHDLGLGLSYYVDPDLKPIFPSRDTSGDESPGDIPVAKEAVRGIDAQIGGDDDVPTNVPSFQESNADRYYHNGLRASDVAYPMYFPTAYTYRAGNERIIDLARLSMPISQDNFGAYSLIVFCTDGIYMMGVDTTGNGVYSTSPSYFNNEVCVNRNSICEIGGAVVFASDKGLMILTSGGVQQFSPQLNGPIRFAPSTAAGTPKDGQHIYNKMVTTSSIVTLKNALSTTDFIDYLKDERTIVTYVSIKNKLLVFNHTKEYVYFIDIPTRNTTKLKRQIAFFDHNYPEACYFTHGVQGANQLYSTHTYEYLSSDDKIECLIQSRPIKIQADDKFSYRLVMSGFYKGDAGQWGDLIILGSLDGDHWRVIGVKEQRLEGGYHNHGCLTERGSWKYLMFIFAGELDIRSHIDSIDLTAQGRYNNKKR